jgi:hypothetical protein
MIDASWNITDTTCSFRWITNFLHKICGENLETFSGSCPKYSHFEACKECVCSAREEQ